MSLEDAEKFLLMLLEPNYTIENKHSEKTPLDRSYSGMNYNYRARATVMIVR